MFKALKRLLGAGSRPVEEVSFSEIETWFENKLKEQPINKELSDLFNEITRAAAMLSLSLKKILHKVISDIPPDHIQTIEEHRDDYVAKMQSFLKQISLEKKNAESIINYYETLSAAIEQIKESSKSHFSIIQKFFSNESQNISESLELFEQSAANLNSLIKKEFGVKFVHDITKLIQLIRKKKKLEEELNVKIKKDEIKRKEAEEYRLKLDTELDDMKTGPDYEKYDSLVSKKIKVENEMERENKNMRILFSPILKILFEYDKRELGADRALARQYASNPIDALHTDKGLWILSLLQSVSSKLPEIEADEPKRMKIRQSILAISENVLKDHFSRYDVFKEAMNQVKKQIMTDITTTKIGDMKYKQNHVLEQLKLSEESRKKHEEEALQLNTEKDLLILEKKLNLLGKVKII